MDMTVCACGCGTVIPAFDGKKRPRRFKRGHQARMPSPGQLAQRARIAAYSRNGCHAWNKGISYVIAKRTVYANRSSWMKAMKRLFPDTCMRCGWAEAPCDVHHISPKGLGGAHTLDNGIILCPNCHRLTHTGKVTRADLRAIRERAIPLVESR